MKRLAMVCCAMLGVLVSVSTQAGIHALIVGGLGGEPEYEKQFKQQAEALTTAIKRLDDEPNVAALTGAQADAAAIRRVLNNMAERASSDDRLVVMLIGHGSFDGEEYRFNIPGPDITASELAALLNRIAARDQLVVLSGSASGGALARLQTVGGGRSRVVITGTKSGAERNATRFAEYWVRALTGKEADVDKDEWVTIREAFDYAERKVADAYKSQTSLATEHARINEVGGARAAQLPIARLGAAKSMPTDPQLRELIAERLRFEREVDAVKTRKAELGEAKYYDELEKALVSLAKTQTRIDSKQATLEQESNSGRGGKPRT